MSTHRVQTRWRDLDALGHVNHPVVLTYLEEGRDAFLAEHGIRREEYVVGRCTVVFRDEIDAGSGSVEVETRVRELGRTSIQTDERIADPDGNILVEAEFGIVLWDTVAREPRAITDAERESLSRSRKEAPA